MNPQTLTAAWTPKTHPSVLVAEQWALGPYRIIRRSGQAWYDLFSPHWAEPFAYDSLELAKSFGARAWHEDIAKQFAKQQLPAEDDEEPVSTADVNVADHGSIVLMRPLTQAAKDWVGENVGDDALWYGGSLVVEPRYVPYLIEGMIEGGLNFR